MKKMIKIIIFLFLYIDSSAFIELPPNFYYYEYASVPYARAMKYIGNGILIVGTKSDKVYVVIDKDNGKKADFVKVFLEKLDLPVGVDYHEDNLYISAVSRIIVVEKVLSKIMSNNLPVKEFSVLYDKLPKDRHHGWKYIRVGPDKKLYIPIGAPCNVCASSNPLYATITRVNLDGSNFEIYVSGVRNSVGFDWDPLTGRLWFSDNGRDWMGDNIPPDEINIAEKEGLHFGFPYIHGKDVKDPEFYRRMPKNLENSFIKPVWELPAHVAPLGIKFYTGKMFPEYYRNSLFIAEHGSWNRSKKIGYRVSFLKLNLKREVEKYEIFAKGFLTPDEKVLGRPVDIEFLDDGSMLVSDDKYGKIYRIYYSKNR